MSKKSNTSWLVWLLGCVVIAIVSVVLWPGLREPVLWQGMASPGSLSMAHESLAGDCAACHVPIDGATPEKCIVCHANNKRLLQRQPTAFHGSISTCRECHPEHQGGFAPDSTMDHATLAAIGLRELQEHGNRDGLELAQFVRDWSGRSGDSWPLLTSATEAALDCNSCHATADPHIGLFGADCVACHGTDSWAIPGYRHPSSRSQECAQCHQAPPSHYMMHFKMISAKVARKPHARVEQCFVCHRTTSWNDIPGIGRYKHH